MKNEASKKALIELLKKIPIIEAACNKVNVGRTSYYRWLKEDPEFAKEATEAIKEGLLLVNDVAESQLLSAIKEGNLMAVTYWLRHHSSTYSDKLEISGQINHMEEDLSAEEKELISEALRLAMPKQIETKEKHDTKKQQTQK